jgi:hypothetical protein
VDKLALQSLKNDIAKGTDRLNQIRQQRDKLDAEQAKLESEVRAFQITYDHYTKTVSPESAQSVIKPDFNSLTIAKAAGLVLRDRENRWTTTREVENAFKQHGKDTRYNAIDGTLKGNKDFERKQEGGRNYFRIKATE